MNINVNIRKLQKALSHKDIIIKVNSYQFFSSEQKRFVTCYSVTQKQNVANSRGEMKLKDVELLKTCSQVEVLKLFVNTYKDVINNMGGD